MMRTIAAETRSAVQNERDARLAAMSASEAAVERNRARPDWMPPQRDLCGDQMRDFSKTHQALRQGHRFCQRRN